MCVPSKRSVSSAHVVATDSTTASVVRAYRERNATGAAFNLKRAEHCRKKALTWGEFIFFLHIPDCVWILCNVVSLSLVDVSVAHTKGEVPPNCLRSRHFKIKQHTIQILKPFSLYYCCGPREGMVMGKQSNGIYGFVMRSTVACIVYCQVIG